MAKKAKAAAKPLRKVVEERERIEYMTLDEIEGWPRNPKQHDMDALGDSIERFGFVMPVLRDERSGRLVAGHGRLRKLRDLKAAGAAPPRRVAVSPSGEWLMPVIRGVAFKTAAEAEAYLMTDNRLPELGGNDKELLSSMLRDHAGRLKGIGYSQADIDALLRSSAPPEDFASYDLDIATNRSCPKCGYSWQESVQKQKRVVGKDGQPVPAAPKANGKGRKPKRPEVRPS